MKLQHLLEKRIYLIIITIIFLSPATPDVSTYKYDATSGYYYDPSTGLYYDANSTYYYNGETGQYLYWDAERSTYLPAPTSEETQDDGKLQRKEKDKQDKVKANVIMS